jgi:hypothetical protein
MPGDLSSFVNSTIYTRESVANVCIAGMKLGTGYVAPTFNGKDGAASNDPGGLFGWLIYSRSNTAYYNPAKGTTSDKYISYTTPTELVGDLNKLTGVTYCLVSNTAVGGTHGFFEQNAANSVVPRNAGNEFLYAINYMAYGGNLVVVGSTTGLEQYVADTDNQFDIVIDKDFDPGVAKWIITQPYTTGIYASVADTAGQTGNGYTMANFTNLFGSSSLVTGTTVANRIFNVYGVKAITDQDTSSLIANTKITYSIPAVSDVGGFFTRTKNLNQLYLTVGGLDRSTVLNGNIINPITWGDTLKTTLRNNKVNFFVNYNPKFLGSDLVGATASSSISVNDRIGPSKLRSALTQAIETIALKYLFEINNATTRSQVVTEIQTAMDPFSPFLDTTKTQIICDETNNTDNTSTLGIRVIVQPILGIDSFVIDVVFTQ